MLAFLLKKFFEGGTKDHVSLFLNIRLLFLLFFLLFLFLFLGRVQQCLGESKSYLAESQDDNIFIKLSITR